MNEETAFDRHERLMQPIRDAQAKTKTETIPMKDLLNDCLDVLQHIVDSEEWDTLQEGSSAEDVIKEIEIKLKEQD